MPFIDRENEIAVLEEEYRQDGASFVVLYGRRRVGKSELLKEFIKGKRALYYLATEESRQRCSIFRFWRAPHLRNGKTRSVISSSKKQTIGSSS